MYTKEKPLPAYAILLYSPANPWQNTHAYSTAELLGIHDKQFENHQNLDHSWIPWVSVVVIAWKG